MPQYGPIPAEIAIIGDQVYQTDGFNLAGKILSKLGIVSNSCYFSTILDRNLGDIDLKELVSDRKTPPWPDAVYRHNLWFSPEVAAACRRLEARLLEVAPKLVIGLGALPLAWFYGETQISRWRGSRLTPVQYPWTFLPTIHPRTLLKQTDQEFILQMDLARAYNIYTHVQTPLAYSFIIQPSFEDVLNSLLGLLRAADFGPIKLSGDLETRAGYIACFGIAWSKTEAICIPHLIIPPPEILDFSLKGLPDTSDPKKHNLALFNETLGNHLWHITKYPDPCFYWSIEEESQIVALYAQLFHHPNITWVGQNYLYDCQYFDRHWGILPVNVRDTMIAHHSLHSNIRKGLDFLSSMYAQDHVYWKDEIKEWDPKIGEKQYWTYNCKDACITYEIDDAILECAKERI